MENAFVAPFPRRRRFVGLELLVETELEIPASLRNDVPKPHIVNIMVVSAWAITTSSEERI